MAAMGKNQKIIKFVYSDKAQNSIYATLHKMLSSLLRAYISIPHGWIESFNIQR